MSVNQKIDAVDGTDQESRTAREREDLQQPRRVGGGLLDPKMLWSSLPDALKKLDPRVQLHNPVMFVVEVGSVLTTYSAIIHPSAFAWTITAWLWLTVLFANLAEAVAEGRGKAQAETLRRTKQETVARRLVGWQPGQADPHEEEVPGTQLTLGDYVLVEPGQLIPGDGVLLGLAQRRGLGLAAALGDRLGQVGEQHGQPEPDGDRPGEDRGVEDRRVGGQHRADLDDEHDGVLELDPRVKLEKCVGKGLPEHVRVEEAARHPAGRGDRGVHEGATGVSHTRSGVR